MGKSHAQVMKKIASTKTGTGRKTSGLKKYQFVKGGGRKGSSKGK
jgi:hypothetical protein